MFRLDLRQHPRSHRNDAIDWSATIAKARAGVQAGEALAAAFDQLSQTVSTFVQQTQAQASQLLAQIETVRTAAQAQAQTYDDIDTDILEDDVPDELVDLAINMNNGDYESELDDLAEPLENMVG